MKESEVKKIGSGDYEDAVYLTVSAELNPFIRVEKNYKIKGKEIDIAVLNGSDNVLIGIECKRKKRPLKKREVIKLRDKLKTIGVRKGYVIAARVTDPGIFETKEEDFDVRVMTIEEALNISWIGEITSILPYVNYDGFNYEVTRALICLSVLDNPWKFIEWLENITFEAWEDTINIVSKINQSKAIVALKLIAETHNDSGWRFQAIDKLDNLGELDYEFAGYLLQVECDPEIREFLKNNIDIFE